MMKRLLLRMVHALQMSPAFDPEEIAVVAERMSLQIGYRVTTEGACCMSLSAACVHAAES